MAEEEKKDEVTKMSLREFLENVPPYEEIEITNLVHPNYEHDLNVTEIENYCYSEKCGDIRFFDCQDTYSSLSLEKWKVVGLFYRCRHCLDAYKWFSLLALQTSRYSGKAMKLGEWPIFGEPVPAKVITLIGNERALFLKGKRCEDQGFGIGAFTYYRRVIENQWQGLIEEIIKVLTHLKKPVEQIDIFEKAKNENQFDKAVRSVKDAIPESLLIDGHHNPITLLHKALSEGVHELSDEQCLDRAKSVRLILFELSERLSNAMKEHSELRKALTKLFGSNKTPKTVTTPEQPEQNN